MRLARLPLCGLPPGRYRLPSTCSPRRAAPAAHTASPWPFATPLATPASPGPALPGRQIGWTRRIHVACQRPPARRRGRLPVPGGGLQDLDRGCRLPLEQPLTRYLLSPLALQMFLHVLRADCVYPPHPVPLKYQVAFTVPTRTRGLQAIWTAARRRSGCCRSYKSAATHSCCCACWCPGVGCPCASRHVAAARPLWFPWVGPPGGWRDVSVPPLGSRRRVVCVHDSSWHAPCCMACVSA